MPADLPALAGRPNFRPSLRGVPPPEPTAKAKQHQQTNYYFHASPTPVTANPSGTYSIASPSTGREIQVP
ncbi:hypothetical protein GCM10009872_59620 [Actinopolymorpha rutila]